MMSHWVSYFKRVRLQQIDTVLVQADWFDGRSFVPDSFPANQWSPFSHI